MSATQKPAAEAERELHKKAFLVVIALIISVVLGWSFLPTHRKAQIIRAVPLGGSYATFDRLAKRLRLGMTTTEVTGILGASEHITRISGGQRWTYDEVAATTGWVCIVDFGTDGRLQYFFNVEHVVFPASPRREFGKPLDGGRFDGDLGLQFYKKREQKTETNSPRTH
jgi:hypothetical protein